MKSNNPVAIINKIKSLTKSGYFITQALVKADTTPRQLLDLMAEQKEFDDYIRKTYPDFIKAITKKSTTTERK